MMDKRKLRKADILTSLFILALGIWIFIESTGMPMKDNYGGVKNVWYVSPALFPLIISIAFVILSVLVFVKAFSEIGVEGIKEMIAGLKKSTRGVLHPSESTIRFFGIMLILITFVYLNIPRIDFFLSSVLFLMAFISMFYFDDPEMLKRLMRFYSIGSAAFLVYFLAGIHKIVIDLFTYGTDVLALCFLIAYTIYARIVAGQEPAYKKKFRMALLLSIVVPLILLPVFKFFLLVPLPVEGGIVDLMSLIRYRVF